MSGQGKRSEPGGERLSPWEAMSRELAANPDSPASLSIMSGINALLRPRLRAVDQIVAAMAQRLVHPGPAADAAVEAAIGHWERASGSPLPANVFADLEQDARERIDRQQRQPPPIERIVQGIGERGDVGYALGLHLEGLRGTWHRLWAAISLKHSGIGDGGDSREFDEAIEAIRAQLESNLGRSLTVAEWVALEQHAIGHAERVLKPTLLGGPEA